MGMMKTAKVRMSALLLGDVLRGDWRNLCRKTTAPDDLMVLGVDQPPHAIGQWFYVIVESGTFRPLPEGAEIPEIPCFSYERETEKAP